MSHYRKPQILIAEDEEDWRERIALPLINEGYNIHFASNEKEARLVLQEQEIDLVIMNVLLRGEIADGWKMDWTNLLGETKSKRISVIIVTAMNKSVSIDQIYDPGLKYDVKRFFFKDSVTQDKLLETVQEILQKKIQSEASKPITSKNFDVFLAHNNEDKQQVREIAEELEQRGIKPWLDEDQIAPGRWFQDVIQKAIPKVKSAAIFIGQKGLGKWQKVELRTFVSQCVENEIPVIPVLLPGVNEIPAELLFLKELGLVKFIQGVHDKKGIENLVWGITGKHPNQNKKS